MLYSLMMKAARIVITFFIKTMITAVCVTISGRKFKTLLIN